MSEKNKQEKNEEYFLLDKSKGGYNVLANSSYEDSIYESMTKVKKKVGVFLKYKWFNKDFRKRNYF